MSSIQSLRSLTLNLPPSCIEFWPLNPQYAVVGTYNLEKQPTNESSDGKTPGTEEAEEQNSQERNGSVILLKVDGDDVKIIQTLPTSFAVLDIHFVPIKHPQSLFGVASSTGSIGLYRLVDDEGSGLDRVDDDSVTPKMIQVQTFDVANPKVLVTAFLWHPRKSDAGATHLIACLSLSNGSITIGEIDPDSATSDVSFEEIASHELEAWTVALALDGLGIYSGGDDSMLKYRTLTMYSSSIWPKNSSNLEHIPATGWDDTRSHYAGVTAILPLIANPSETLVVTGSYDDHVRLISVPTNGLGRRNVLTEMNLGGGVWRLKRLKLPHQASSTSEDSCTEILILASCMHVGARILRLNHDAKNEWSFEIFAKFEEHKSMNYGSDCQPHVNDKGQQTFITTSFYDRLLCLWRY